MGNKDADARSMSSGSEAPKSQSSDSVASRGHHSGSVRTLAARRELFDMKQASLFRRTVYELVESDFFNYFILAVIMLNTLILGLQTSQMMVKAFGAFCSRVIERVVTKAYICAHYRVLLPAHGECLSWCLPLGTRSQALCTENALLQLVLE